MNLFEKKEKTLLDIEIEDIISQNINALQGLINNFEVIFEKIWQNRNATPQEIFNAFGTDASKLFNAANETIKFIQTLKPDYKPPVVPFIYTVQKDGTVKVGDKK